MPLKIVKVTELRRATRNKASVVQGMSEFIECQTKLAHGLRPQEAIEITFPKSTERGHKHLKTLFKKHVRDYLKKLGLESKYSVSTHSDGQEDIIQIVAEAPLVARRKPR